MAYHGGSAVVDVGADPGALSYKLKVSSYKKEPSQPLDLALEARYLKLPHLAMMALNRSDSSQPCNQLRTRG